MTRIFLFLIIICSSLDLHGQTANCITPLNESVLCNTVQFNYTLNNVNQSDPLNHVYFKLVRIEGDQSPATAILLNAPLALITDNFSGSIFYGSPYPELEKGKHYAWQVSVEHRGEIVFNTVPQEFSICISENGVACIPTKLKPNGDFTKVETQICILHKSRDSELVLSCKIVNHQAKNLDIENPVDGSQFENEILLKKTGMKSFIIEFPSSFERGYYTLELKDNNGKMFFVELELL